MTSTHQIVLLETFRLEEINMPEHLATAMSGQSVAVQVIPGGPEMSRRIDLEYPPAECLPVVIDDKGIPWNGYCPVRASFADPESKAWKLPRH